MGSPYDSSNYNFGSYGGYGSNGRQLGTSYGVAPEEAGSGALAGAGTGAAAGTMLSPGMGTVIGAGIGAVGSYMQAREQRETEARRMALEGEMNQRQNMLSTMQNTGREQDVAFQNIMGAASQSLFRK